MLITKPRTGAQFERRSHIAQDLIDNAQDIHAVPTNAGAPTRGYDAYNWIYPSARESAFPARQGGKGTLMSCGKTIVVRLAPLAVVLGTAVLFGQSTVRAPSSTLTLEFPVVMRQNVVAGKTPVGTKIQAKLAVATLVNGVVIPQDAILLGEVIESAPKSATEPSRLAIRVDSAQWKKESMPIVFPLASKVYLTAWYYPVETPAAQDFPEGLPEGPRGGTRHRGGSVPYPNPGPQDSPPYSRGNTDETTKPATPAPSPAVSPHRVLMKNIKSTRGNDGSVTLTSNRSNIKLDKSTTYVLAVGDLLSAKQ